MMTTREGRDALSKLPEVTLVFWIIKIAATTLGETGGDAVTMSMRLGYLVGTLIFAVALILLVWVQVAVKRLLADAGNSARRLDRRCGTWL